MTREVPIKNLEDIHYAALAGVQKPDLCHAYAIFKKEERKVNALVWYLYDEYKEIGVYVCGKLEEYPRPRPGDVVRIHRLRIDAKNRRPEISMGRNVVYWPAFQYDPKPVATAKNPTITEEDTKRRRVLEALFSSNIIRCSDILRSNDNDPYTWFQAVAGRVETNHLDMFEHHEVKFRDGTELPPKAAEPLKQPTLRVFKPTKPDDCAEHYDLAKTLKQGQYFVATNVKLARNYNLNLSANNQYGRSLRLVEEASILGVKLKESLGSTDEEPQTTSISPSNSQTLPKRRSPRLHSQNPVDETQASTSTSTITNNVATKSTTASTPPASRPPVADFPQFHRFSEIKPKLTGYDFYNIIGQVRDKPRVTKLYGNCVVQLFDGSRHNHASCYDDEVGQIIDGCLVLYIYSKQNERDTNEHFERAMSLKPGDIVYVQNIKISLRNGRVRMELQANKLHNKSINPIDVDSPFGRKILDIVQTPQVEEIMTNEASDSSQEPAY